MIVTKANAKENPGKIISLSITKAKAKTNSFVIVFVWMVSVTQSRPQSELQVIYSFLCREGCGEVFGSCGVTNFKPDFLGKEERKFATKNPPVTCAKLWAFLAKNSCEKRMLRPKVGATRKITLR